MRETKRLRVKVIVPMEMLAEAMMKERRWVVFADGIEGKAQLISVSPVRRKERWHMKVVLDYPCDADFVKFADPTGRGIEVLVKAVTVEKNPKGMILVGCDFRVGCQPRDHQRLKVMKAVRKMSEIEMLS